MTDPTPQFTLIGPGGELIATGSMSAVTEHILDSASRRAAKQLIADAAQASTLLDQIQEQRRKVFSDNLRLAHRKLADMVKRMDALEAEEKEQQRLDAEEEQRQIQQMLDELPDPDDPPPTGDLTHHGPPDQKRYGAEDQGELPEELTKKIPPDPGNYFDPDPDNPDPPPTVRDPPAVSLNAERS